MTTPITLHHPRRVGPGRYVVPSETTAGVEYSVQIAGDRGDCNCIGSESAARAGNQCKHVRECVAAERTYAVSNENEHGTAVVVREADVYSPMPVTPPHSLIPSMDEVNAMTEMANRFYELSGSMIPSEIKTPAEAFAIMVAGRELGIAPMASFREIHVVKGRTMPSARVLMGLVQAGDPQAVFTWIERTTKKAHVRLTRGNGQAIEVEYTIEDATRAGLTGNDVWRRYPADMLAYKAVTRACRLGGADLITGIGATVRGATSYMHAIEDDGNDGEVVELKKIERPANNNRPPTQEQRRASQHRVGKDKSERPQPNPKTEINALVRRVRDECDPETIARVMDYMREVGAYAEDGTPQLSAMTMPEATKARDALKKLLDGDGPPAADDGAQGRLDA